MKKKKKQVEKIGRDYKFMDEIKKIGGITANKKGCKINEAY